MSGVTGDGPTVATLRLDLPCDPLPESDTDAAVEVAEVRYDEGEGYVALVWTTAGDAASLGDTLGEWEGVRAVDALSTAGESRLLRLDLADDSAVTEAYEALVEHDVLLSSCVGTAAEWTVRLTAPSHGALTAVYARLQRLGVGVDLKSVGGETTDSEADDGLTDSQREALVCAAESGYFSVPRTATLKEVGERLEVSDQAVSERIRRGTDRLVREHVAEDGAGSDASAVGGASAGDGRRSAPDGGGRSGDASDPTNGE